MDIISSLRLEYNDAQIQVKDQDEQLIVERTHEEACRQIRLEAMAKKFKRNIAKYGTQA